MWQVEQLEDECCAAEHAKLAVEKDLAEERCGTPPLALPWPHRCEERRLPSSPCLRRLVHQSATRELERLAARAHIQPAGLQELQDQLEVAGDVREALCNDVAKTTEELVEAKLQLALAQTERDELVQRLRKGTQKQQKLALRITELEVQLANAQNAHADQEEELAQVFRDAMQRQEERIRELEAHAPKPAQKPALFGWGKR